MICAGTKHDLSQVKQEENETLRSYTRCFLEICATIANISDEDVICCFRNGLASKLTYRDFGCNLPKTVVELCDMMQRWADQEDEENEHFPKRNDKGGNDGRPDKSQRNNSGSSRKRKTDNHVAAIECNQRSKKPGKLQDQFEKVVGIS